MILQKLFKGGNYSREETIRGNMVSKKWFSKMGLISSLTYGTFHQFGSQIHNSKSRSFLIGLKIVLDMGNKIIWTLATRRGLVFGIRKKNYVVNIAPFLWNLQYKFWFSFSKNNEWLQRVLALCDFLDLEKVALAKNRIRQIFT